MIHAAQVLRILLCGSTQFHTKQPLCHFNPPTNQQIQLINQWLRVTPQEFDGHALIPKNTRKERLRPRFSLYLHPSPMHGVGLFAHRAFYQGQVLPFRFTLDQEATEKDHDLVCTSLVTDKRGVIYRSLGLASFMNHACPDCCNVQLVKTVNYFGNQKLMARTGIDKDQELLLTYNKELPCLKCITPE